MKEKAVTDIFETSLVLINNATDTFQHGSQPEASLPTTQSLYQMCCRARSGIRPRDFLFLDVINLADCSNVGQATVSDERLFQ